MPRPSVPTIAALADVPTPRKLAAIVVASCFGFAIQLRNGYYAPEAMELVVLGLAAVIAALIAGERQLPLAVATHGYALVLGVALTVQISMLTAFPPLKQNELHGYLTLWCFQLALVGVYVACAFLQLQPRNYPLMIIVFAALGWLAWWVVEQQPEPPIDVWVFGQEGARGLLRGDNPFALTFPNLYGDPSPYAPSLASSTRILHGYPYPPINLVPAMLGLTFGDCRFGLSLCLLAVVVLLGIFEQAWLFAALLVLTPRGPMMLEQAFIEPLGVMCIALAAVASGRWPRLVPVAVGLAIASKQVNLLFAPAALLLPELRLERARLREGLRAWAIALGTATASFVPFFLAAPRAMFESLITSQGARLHAMPETLTFATPFAMRTGEHLSPAVAGGLYVSALGLLYVFAPRTREGFAMGTGLLAAAFFICNRQANINYYFFMLACFWVAAALRPAALRSADV